MMTGPHWAIAELGFPSTSALWFSRHSRSRTPIAASESMCHDFRRTPEGHRVERSTPGPS